MTGTALWREFESGDSFVLRALRASVLACGLIFLCFTATIELTWPQQAGLAALMLLIAVWLDRNSSSYVVTLTLMLLSVYATCRYAFWRSSISVGFFRNPGARWNGLDAFFICLLLMAEGYALVALFLGYLQMLWPLRRIPVPLPDDVNKWPAVDVLIPTLNEPLSVVRFTVLAAMNIDWPAEKLNVHILDDGGRDEFRVFAEEAGVAYITRGDNRYAKAGNINHALPQLNSPYIAIFDSDHVPTRSFLQMTMGWFLRDQKLGVLQTPHHFYSPDPFERNLDQFRIIPNEGELFYGVVQDGNDFWNATTFCGSCAVLRRSALDEVGGVAIDTVTEDAHTSLRLQASGWNTAYINIPQAAGLATERLNAHIKQRIRWARGMVQILRIENPLFAPGLKPAQRLCYFNAMTHFLYALPRLVFLTAPLIYLVLGKTNIPGYWVVILAYATPHLVLSRMTNSRVQGQHRHSFWNEIYETVLAPYIFLPTLLALVSPKLGRFNVTAKGGVVNEEFFDVRIARPFLLLMAMNLFGLLCAVPRLIQFPLWHVPAATGWSGRIASAVVNWPASLYDGSHTGAIWMNVIWTLFNVILLGVATAVAWETQQRRRSVRVAMAVPSDVVLADGTIVRGVTSDLSSGGVRTRLESAMKVGVGDRVRLIFLALGGSAALPATVIGIDGKVLRAQFGPLTLQEEEALTMILYSRADTWLGWGKAREADRPLHSLGRIVRLSIHGLWQTLRGLRRGAKSSGPKERLVSALPILLVLFACGGMVVTRAAHGQRSAGASIGVWSEQSGKARSGTVGTFDNVFTLADIGATNTIVLRGVDATHSLYFSVPRNDLVKTATMRLRFHFSPGLLPEISHLNVSLNGTLVATLPVTAQPTEGAQLNDLTPEEKVAAKRTLSVTRAAEQNGLLEAGLLIPSDLLVRNNQLTFQFIGHYSMQCEDPSHSTLWSHIDTSSTVELTGSLLPLQNDLSLLPLPFYDGAVNMHPVVPIVFLSQPSAKGMHAAGIIASWLGIIADYHPVRFPVSIGTIPAGNAIVIAEGPSQIPVAMNFGPTSGPTLAIRSNPGDPYSKVLLVTGDSADDLVRAATAVSLQRDMLQGSQMSFPSLKMPSPRRPDDAPRWLSTDRNRRTNIGVDAQAGDLQGDGSMPVGVYMRVPPDLYYGSIENLGYHLSYRYNGIPLGDGSTLQMYMNSAYVSSTPMPHTDGASRVLDTVVPIPVADMRPFSNSAMMQFAFQAARSGHCQGSAPTNLQGAVLKDSYLDIAGLPHWTKLPNLELFANAGYPFTRLADLAETAVVLPDQPSSEELEMFLTMMGHFGAQTGYPVLNVTVTAAAGMSSASGKDYLVMGTVDDQPALKTLDSALPVGVEENGLHIRDTAGFFERSVGAWWRRGSGHMSSGQLETVGGLPDALIEGIEWPRGSDRSVVVMVLRDPAVVPRFLSTFLAGSQSSDMAESVSVLRGTRFSSYRIGTDGYWVGDISLPLRVTMFLQEYPWVIVLLVVLFSFLMASLIRVNLRRSARMRLHGNV